MSKTQELQKGFEGGISELTYFIYTIECHKYIKCEHRNISIFLY